MAGSGMQVTSAEIDEIVEGQTVSSAFAEMVSTESDRVALRWRTADQGWDEWTFGEYGERVARVAAGLKDRGLEPGDRIVLMLRNIPEFHVVDMAAVACGATPVSIYNSSAPEQVQYLAGHCEAKIGLVEDLGFLERFLKVRDDLPVLEQLGILHDPDGLAGDGVFTYAALLDHDGLDLAEASKVASPDDLATIIYTSGTTGPPKGVMISHYNVAWTVESLGQRIDWDSYLGRRVVSYLPMAHIAERVVSHYQQVFRGLEVTSCPDASEIALYLREVRPNLVFGVPRVWEKINAGVVGSLHADPEAEKKFTEATEAAIAIDEARTWDRATDEQLATWDFLDEAVFRSVRELIGLDQVDLAITGAAPIPAELLSWFRAIGVPLSEIYGMSETSGPMTYTALRVKPGTVGQAIPGCEVTLADDGEVICRGGNVFAGYLNDPDKTAEALDADGWLHSGDIGEVDDDGYVRIVDRKKELIITAGGKNISPANLEAALKLVPLVGQACAIRDQRKFVAALVVLDPDTGPAWATRADIEFDAPVDLATHADVVSEVERGVKEVMEQFNNAERVKKVTVLGEEWLPDSEELTPTSKLKRRGIHSKYEAEIEALYA